MAIKRTFIGPDEELIIQGKLSVEGNVSFKGNVTQYEEVSSVTKLAGDSLEVNSDSENTTATLALNSNGTYGNISYDDSTGLITVSAPMSLPSGNITTDLVGDVYASNGTSKILENGTNGTDAVLTGQVTDISNHDTDDLSEGTTNLYFTPARVRSNISVTDSGGDGSLSYNNGTGVITYTGPSQAEANARIDAAPTNVRAHFSAGTGLTLSSGQYSITNTAVTSGSYGSASIVPTYTVNAQGQLTSASNTTINITSSQVSNFTSSVNSDVEAYITGGDGIDFASGTIDVDSTVVRTSGAQSIGGQKTFTSQVNVTADIIPTAGNTYSLGSWANHFDYVFANVLHAEHLDLSDANISDIHNTFVAGVKAGPLLTTNTANGLIYTHNAQGAAYGVSTGDGLEIQSNNLAVDSTVVRTSGTQTIAGSKTFTSDLQVQGNLDVTGNINSLTQTDLFVEDTKITLANGSVSNVDAFIYVEGNYANNPFIKWETATNRWQISNNGTTVNDVLLLSDFTGGTGITFSSNTFSITNTAVTSGSYGAAGIVPTFTVNAQGQLTAASNTTISITSSQVSNFTSSVNSDVEAYITGGVGIDFASGTIDVDTTVIRTTGNQSLAGTKTFTGTLVAPSSSATANGAIYYDNVTGKAYIYVGGMAKEITPAVDAGDVEDVGATGTNIYAGTRVVGNVTYHGIKSIDSGTYTSLSEASNVITVDGNITAIRGAFSVTDTGGYGSLTYTAGTGVITYTGPSASEIRGLISGTGLISYNNTTGVISTTADNYSSWSFDTTSASPESVGSGETVTFNAGSGIDITHSGKTITISTDSDADISAVVAGTGLTGGGTSGSVTLNVDETFLANIATNVTTTGNITGDYVFASSFFEGDLNGAVTIDVNNNTGATLNKGTAVYLTGGYSGDNPNVALANNTVSSTMPAIGIVKENISAGSIGQVVTNGVMNFSSHGYTLGADLYINGGGNLTTTVPTGEANLLQKIGKVVSPNHIIVQGAFRTNAVPNLNLGNIFLGSAGNQAVTAVLNTSIVPESGNLYFTNARARAAFSGSSGVNYDSGTGAITADSAEIRALFSASAPLSYNNTTGQFSITEVGDISAVTAGAGLTGGGSSGAVTLNIGAGSYITVNADDVAVDATTTNTASKVVARDGSGNVYASYFNGTATSAFYADLAEKYESDSNYEAGTVVVFGGEKEITITSESNSPRVAGVISTEPAYMMNSEADGQYVALRGRVPCKVVGPVKKGDVLITSSRPGFAEASDQPHFVSASCIVGKALQNFDGTEGVIEVVV